MRAAMGMIVLLACSHSVTRSVDASLAQVDADEIGIGAPCATNYALCDDFAGVCIQNVCRLQCAVVSFPRCAPGYVENHSMNQDAGADICVCVPD